MTLDCLSAWAHAILQSVVSGLSNDLRETRICLKSVLLITSTILDSCVQILKFRITYFKKITVRGRMVGSAVCNSLCYCLWSKHQHQHQHQHQYQPLFSQICDVPEDPMWICPKLYILEKYRSGLQFCFTLFEVDTADMCPNQSDFKSHS